VRSLLPINADATKDVSSRGSLVDPAILVDDRC
jgi:hypothetical protein